MRAQQSKRNEACNLVIREKINTSGQKILLPEYKNQIKEKAMTNQTKTYY